MKKIIIVMLLISVAIMGASAQKLSGTLIPLKDQKEVNIVIDFSGTLVDGKTEQKYINEELKKRKTADKEKWLNEWHDNLRFTAYSMLIRELNKTLNPNLFIVDDIPNAEYTIYVKVKEIKTGFFSKEVAKPSELKVEVRFVKTDEVGPFATIEFPKVSNKSSFDTPYFITRIGQSFGTLGGSIGMIINKNLKKK